MRLGMSGIDALDPEDRIKIETWSLVMRLLRHYRDVTYWPEYQLPTGLVLPSDLRNARERRVEKLAKIGRYEKELEAKWEAGLGNYWQSILDPND
jgi:hypothetical protein